MKFIEKLKNLGYKPEDLDDLVHSVFSEMATDVNNKGLPGQANFLVNNSNVTEEDILNHLAKR